MEEGVDAGRAQCMGYEGSRSVEGKGLSHRSTADDSGWRGCQPELRCPMPPTRLRSIAPPPA